MVTWATQAVVVVTNCHYTQIPDGTETCLLTSCILFRELRRFCQLTYDRISRHMLKKTSAGPTDCCNGVTHHHQSSSQTRPRSLSFRHQARGPPPCHLSRVALSRGSAADSGNGRKKKKGKKKWFIAGSILINTQRREKASVSTFRNSKLSNRINSPVLGVGLERLLRQEINALF